LIRTAEVVATAEPAPAALTAETRNRYLVPLTSPVTVAVVVAEAARVNVVQVEPALLLNSIL
jgi:hypothetical protein